MYIWKNINDVRAFSMSYKVKESIHIEENYAENSF